MTNGVKNKSVTFIIFFRMYSRISSSMGQEGRHSNIQFFVIFLGKNQIMYHKRTVTLTYPTFLLN